MTTITEYIKPLLQGESLSFEKAMSLLDIIFEGQVADVQIAAFLTAMRAKGVTAAELAGLAKSLRKHAVAVKVDIDNLVDTCGTGAAAIKTFNISTTAALVAAGAGVYVAKHGNRGITSSCGSADVLAELGVKIDASAEVVAECIREAHIGFMFAPVFHPAMKYVQPIRKTLGFRTVFNILGPLANPANAQGQVLGVADENLMPTIADALKLLGTRYAMVVHSNGLDEISTAAVTKIVELRNNQIASKELNPEDLGMAKAGVEQLKVTNAQVGAKVLMDILSGKDTGPRKDIVLLNAAAAIIAGCYRFANSLQNAGPRNLVDDFKSAISKAEDSVSSGKALACLEKLIELSNKA